VGGVQVEVSYGNHINATEGQPAYSGLPGKLPLNGVRVHDGVYDVCMCVCVFQVQLSLPGHLQCQHWLVVACYLVKHGADVTAVNSSGKTPMHYASDDVIADILRRCVDESVVCLLSVIFHTLSACWH